ncbi:MAG: hypothetical protein QGI68_19645 [Pseudomonadales bacterium]|jgi:hypothetical protein|nr:hypothetical protein [Pseudomonadales bacterium]MDP7597760.1 hypothetical protein [Pseudomonadales bacterium]HJN52353.1 hypothetical protein [Pseudomonadales bacterium]|tara:strand:+ start:266 stop:598 length:333 start_codon:yes stop_codon:yes gene_type:complete
MKITFVKKILADGRPCQKCAEVQQRLEKSGQIARMDEILIADERDPESAGMQLAEKLNVNRAPFFVVETKTDTKVYTVYFKFVKEILGATTAKIDEAKEILTDNPDLDFI